MFEKRRIVVIGAGPAGVTAAYELSKRNQFEIDIFEASGCIGGMARTIPLWNQKVDLGPHRFFSKDPRVNRLWREVVKDHFAIVNRLARIYYRGKFFLYPLRASNALFNLGVFEATLCMLSHVRYRLFPLHPEETFEAWVTNRFGRRLYRIFFKTYTEKLWGIDCHELDADFAAQRIKKLSLFEAIKNALLRGRGNQHPTLLDRFAYPLSGSGYTYERMAAEIARRGGRVHLHAPVKRVLSDGKLRTTGVELSDGRIVESDHIISTMPLTLLVQRLEEAPGEVLQASSRLRYRNTILVYLKVDGHALFPDQWLYVHASELKTGRLTNFRNWVPTLYGSEKETILALEYWCYDEDPMWASTDAECIEIAKSEIRKTGLTADCGITDGHVIRIHRSYPVYQHGYREDLGIVENYLRKWEGLSPIGRNGSFKYNNQDHSILMGYLAAENIAGGAAHDLWAINTDYEYHERHTISEADMGCDTA